MIHPIRPVNGQTKIRSLNCDEPGITVLDCGCAYDRHMWLQVCGREWPQYERIHEEAHREHMREKARGGRRA